MGMALKGIQKWIGGRVLKTGLAVLITSAVCITYDLPVIFAVITAIVSIEPTTAASIKKAAIRFPAAAVGAGFAMFFDYLFGQTPITFALAAMFTIWVCHRLHWDDAILVATLTATAMIPETSAHFLSAFFIRLATTSIGIIVSTVVNLVVLPPRFNRLVEPMKDELYTKTGALIGESVSFLLQPSGNGTIILYKTRYQALTKQLERAFRLLQYQREEWGYRRHTLTDLRRLTVQQKELDLLQKILFHLGDLLMLKPETNTMDYTSVINEATTHIVRAMQSRTVIEADALKEGSRQLKDMVLHMEDRRGEEDYFNDAELLCYEILAIQQALFEKKKFYRFLQEAPTEPSSS